MANLRTSGEGEGVLCRIEVASDLRLTSGEGVVRRREVISDILRGEMDEILDSSPLKTPTIAICRTSGDGVVMRLLERESAFKLSSSLLKTSTIAI